MSGNLGMQSLLTGLLTLCSASLFGQQDAVVPTFTAQPNQCVALYQGEHCQLKIQLHWRANSQVCAYLADTIKPLACWPAQTQQGELTIKLESDQQLQLRDHEQRLLGEQSLTYAWVYNKASSRRVRWRLF